MPNLRNDFTAYYRLGEDVIEAAPRTGQVTSAAKVMLAAYRFERQAREQLLNAFCLLRMEPGIESVSVSEYKGTGQQWSYEKHA